MPINRYIIVTFFFFLLAGGLLQYLKRFEFLNDLLKSNNIYAFKIKAYPIKVKIIGSIKNPGIYTLTNGNRIKDLIDKAGKISQSGFLIYNKNSFLQDGKVYNIPFKKLQKGNKININSASLASLCRLPGITENLAKQIFYYRKSRKGFKNIREILDVYGIGIKKYEVIKNFVVLGE